MRLLCATISLHAGDATVPTAPQLANQGTAAPHQGLSPASSQGFGTSSSAGSMSPARVGPANMLKLGLTRSLNSKKSSPNRVCCNALLAAYARATPPRWRQVRWRGLETGIHGCVLRCQLLGDGKTSPGTHVVFELLPGHPLLCPWTPIVSLDVTSCRCEVGRDMDHKVD